MSETNSPAFNTKHPEIFYRVGAISLQWNKVNFYLELLLQSLLNSADNDLILQAVGDRERGLLTAKLLERHEPADWQGFILHMAKFADICRANRNLILHGLVRDIGDDYLNIERLTKRPLHRKVFKVRLPVLIEVETSMCIASAHLGFILLNSTRDLRRAALPERPALPRSLEGCLPEVLLADFEEP